MTASSSCKLIDYHAYRKNKRLAAYHKRRYTGHLSPQETHTKNTPCHLSTADDDRNFDRQLQTYENSARCKCFKIHKNLSLKKLPGGLEQMLIQRMIEHPQIIERPIVVVGRRAVLGRPPENVLEII